MAGPSIFPPTLLDADQAIRGAYDEANGRFRVETAATIIDGAVEVAITAEDDNIAIKDPVTGATLRVNSDGSINANTTGIGGNASVGLTGTTAPTSATELGAIDPSGDLVGLKTDNTGALVTSGTSTVTGDVTTTETGLNAFQTSQYTVGLTAIQLVPTALANRSSLSVAIIADPTAIVYIGNDNTVTTSTGYPLYDKNSIELDLTPTGQIWAISDTTNQTVAVMEIG